MVGAAAPKEKEKDPDKDEREAESDPETESAPVAPEAQVSAERKADQPVGREVAQHRGARVSGAAESTGGNGLDAVEELEGGAGSKENNGGANDRRVGGVDAGDVARENQKSHAHARHEGGAEENGGVAGIAGAGRIPASDGLADANSGGRRNTERNHVSEGNGIESDLVRGKRDGAQTRDE